MNKEKVQRLIEKHFFAILRTPDVSWDIAIAMFRLFVSTFEEWNPVLKVLTFHEHADYLLQKAIDASHANGVSPALAADVITEQLEAMRAPVERETYAW